MKIVVIGGSGLIGSKVVERLRAQGHEALAASPRSGVNTLTGEGLAEALAGAAVVVDVSNAPAWGELEVLAFFQTSTGNLLAAAKAAGVGHLVALSIVGTQRLPESGYFRAKVAQEQLIAAGDVPYTIVHATQFMEFIAGIADGATTDGVVHAMVAQLQPIAADDVADAVTAAATGAPANGPVQIAGPEAMPIAEAIGRVLTAKGDPREIIADPAATYFGATLADRSLIPDEGAAQLGATNLETWLTRQG